MTDLTGAVEGFSLGARKSQIKKHFPPPEIPKDWLPKKDPSKKKSRFDQTPKEASKEKERVINTNPSVDERRSRLFPDEVSGRKLEEVSGKKFIPETKIISGGFREKKPEEKPITKAEVNLILSDSSTKDDHFNQSGFKPFERDAEKQKRYEQYLRCLKNGRGDALGILQPKEMLAWEKERERVEFDRAAIMFRPTKGGMSNKFVSGGNVEDTDAKKGGVLNDPESEAKAQKRKAADMKMFGKLTREQVDWHPARMLCVRFNVKHPYSDYSVVGVASRRTTPKEFSLFASLEQEQVKDAGAKDKVKEEEDVKVEDKENKVEEKEAEKPSMDLFKAIFLDSDSDSDEEMETEEDSSTKEAETRVERELAPKVPLKPWEEKKQNLLRNNEPARGIFANIDFDALNKKRVNTEEVNKESGEEAAPKPIERSKEVNKESREEA